MDDIAFQSGFRAPDEIEKSFLFCINKGQVLVTKAGDIPSQKDFLELGNKEKDSFYFGDIGNAACYAIDGSDTIDGDDAQWISIRQLFNNQDSEVFFWAASLANHLLHWKKTHTYCGVCQAELNDSDTERALICPDCELTVYPRISPAVIVAIVKDNQILLANAKRFPFDFYSVLAGFVEPGENLETCVKREVFEEVGIEVTDIEYFSSQPWPFPDSLMIGFTAKWAGGDIVLDKDELKDAKWFCVDDIPEMPAGPSIAKQLINWFVQSQQNIKEG